MWKLSKKIGHYESNLGQLEMRIVSYTRKLQDFNQQKTRLKHTPSQDKI